MGDGLSVGGVWVNKKQGQLLPRQARLIARAKGASLQGLHPPHSSRVPPLGAGACGGPAAAPTLLPPLMPQL